MSVDIRQSRKGSIEEIVATALLAKEEVEHTRRASMHKEICTLFKNSPYDKETTNKLLSHVRQKSNEIWEALRRAHYNIAERRGIQEERIAERYMAPEGHRTLILQIPGYTRKLLFREGDQKSNAGHVSFENLGTQPNGSIFVELGSKDHIRLREKTMMFRWTSLGPDHGKDDDDGENNSVPVSPLIGELVS